MIEDVLQEVGEQRLREQIDGFQRSAIIYAAVKLSLPDKMGSECWTAERLADEARLSAPHLLRLLRALVGLGICEETPERTFKLASAGKHLTSDSPSGLREKAMLAGEQYWQPWANLAHCVDTGETAFERVFGMPPWEWRNVNADQGAVFNAGLAKETIVQARCIIGALDLSGATTVADIGGGSGGLLAAILNDNPQVCGVLFDQPGTVDRAKQFLQSAGITARVEFVGGDFFSEIPVTADVYLLKSVLHDWNDADCGTILRNCYKAMPTEAKLLIIERLLPEYPADDETAIMIDMHMMVVTGGRERQRQEFESLLSRAELNLETVISTEAGFSVLQATPRRHQTRPAYEAGSQEA